MNLSEHIINRIVSGVLDEAKVVNGLYKANGAKGQYISGELTANVQIPVVFTMNAHSNFRSKYRNIDEESVKQVAYQAIPFITNKIVDGKLHDNSQFCIIDKQSCLLIGCTVNIHKNMMEQINIKTMYLIDAKASAHNIKAHLNNPSTIILNNDNPSANWVYAFDNMLDANSYSEYVGQFRNFHDPEHSKEYEKKKRKEMDTAFSKNAEEPNIDKLDDEFWDEHERELEQHRLAQQDYDSNVFDKYGNAQRFLHNKGAGQREFFNGNTTRDQLKDAQNNISWDEFNQEHQGPQRPTEDEIARMISKNNNIMSRDYMRPDRNKKSRDYIRNLWKQHGRENRNIPSQDEIDMMHDLGF